MKKILFVLLLLPFLSEAQGPPTGTYTPISGGVNYGRFYARSMNLPQVTTRALAPSQWPGAGAIIYDSLQHGVYINIGNNIWVRLADTTYTGFNATITKVGTGFPIGITGTSNIRSVAGSNTITLDSLTSNTVTFHGDTSYLATKADINHQFLGSRYSATTFASTTGFTNKGVTVAATGGKLVFNGTGASNFSKSLSLIPATMAEHWKGTASFTVDSSSATSYGAAFGIQSINVIAYVNTVVKFDMTSGANKGKISINVGDVFGAGATSTTGVAFSVGDSIKVTIERDVNKIIATARNLTTGSAEISIEWRHYFTNGVFMHNTGQFSIFQLGGGFSVYNLNYEVRDVKNADLVILADSKFGYYAPDYYSSWTGLLKFAIPNTVVHAGPGDQLIHLSASLQEVIDLHPKNVLMAIGCNSVRNGESGYQARYDSIAAALTAAGIIVYHLEPTYETVLDQTSFLSHIRTTFSASNIIDIYDEIKKNYAAYLYSDGIHFTAAGHRFVYETVLSAFKIPAAKAIINPEIWIRNRNGTAQTAGFDVSDSSRVRALFIAGGGVLSTPAFQINSGPGFWNSVYALGGRHVVSWQDAPTATTGTPVDWYANDTRFFTYTPTVTQVMNFNAGKILLPALTNQTAQNRLVGQTSSNGQIDYVTNGYGLTLSSGVEKLDSATVFPHIRATIPAGGGSGTVTNVATGLGLSGGPITTTGTIIADTTYLLNKSTQQIVSGHKNFTGGLISSNALINTISNTDPITGTAVFKVADANGMSLTFRDHATGQGYLAVGNGTMTGYVGHTNTAQGFTLGSYTNHKTTIVQNNSPMITMTTGKQIGIYTVTSPSAFLHLPAGVTTAGYAPIKIDNGVRTTVAVDGQIEKADAFYLTKLNAVRFGVGGSLNSQYTDVGNIGTGEDDLMSYTLPAGTLSQNGDYLEIEMLFGFTGSNTKTVKVYFGAQAVSVRNNTAAGFDYFKIIIHRTGAATQLMTVTGNCSVCGNTVVTNVSPTETLSGAITIKATGEATSNNDVIQRQMTVKYFPAN